MPDERPSIDPRYDARYQRGYVPAAGPVTEPASGEADAAPSARPRPQAAVETRLAVEPGRASTSIEPVETTADQPADPPAADPPSSDRGEPPVDDGAEPARAEPAGVVLTRWLWLVVGTGVAFVAVGIALYWGVLTRRNPFNGGIGAQDAVTDNITMALSPQLVLVGVLGVVAALLAWALVGRDRPTAGEGTPRERGAG